MILLLAGVIWHNSYFLILAGLALFIYGNYMEKKENHGVDFNYGLGMILLAALTEAFIYFLVRRVKTTNHWNHVFISYFLGAVIMSAYVVYENYTGGINEPVSDKGRVGLSILINGVIGSVGYFLRFYSSYRLDASIYAPLSYFGVVMSYVYGILFDNEKLGWEKVLGTGCILASNYFAPKGV
jgi:drug/metabolite transporter (DMT)-like permease